MTTPLWSGRFAGPPNARLFEFGRSLAIDKRLLADDIAGSQAWARALGRAGVLTASDVDAIVSGLSAFKAAVEADPSIVDTAPDEDVHSFVERQLIERIGDLGRRLHTGRSRNEQVSVDTRLYLKRRIHAAPLARSPRRRTCTPGEPCTRHGPSHCGRS